MKNKKWLIPTIITVIVVVIIGIITLNIFSNASKLTSEERKWINSNINNLQNIYVTNDETLFSKDGHGVFYSFLDDFSQEYGIKLNIVNLESGKTTSDVSLTYTKSLNSNSKILYTDHYVLLSKNEEIFNDYKDLEDKKVGTLNNDLDYIKNYLKDVNINYTAYNNVNDLLSNLGNNVDYIILPRIKYLNEILTNNLKMVYHLSDIKVYYAFNGDNSIFSNILTKFFQNWEHLDEYLKKEEFMSFTKALNISDAEVDKLLSIDYKYGFVNNSPYEVIMSGNYGGIVAEYLQEFSKFSGVYFDITKYRNTNKLVSAINRGKVDLYFAFNNDIESNFNKTTNGINSSISILTNKSSDKVINSIYGLQGEKVYVANNSNLLEYLTNIGNIEIHTYDNLQELFKLDDENAIIVMDTYIYDYYSTTKLSNYVSEYNGFINKKYPFRVKSDYQTLYTLLNTYMAYLDNSSMINLGLNSHNETITSGNILNNIAKYFILSIIAILFIGYIVYRNKKKIKIARRLNKDDKIRFIDELTCLKNRAYLSDFIKSWSNNTIYPQAIIVVDLNKIQEINDKYGVSEGDKQIQNAANALIKTQLDNSDLMRSDGNEFVIYTVGYNQKQIINYIHKLNKELKKLPYNFGAEFGYSIIENNLKTVEDALNEATIDMKSKKGSGNSEK